ncbi:hypothetical protein [Sphaerisporangium sp. NPDC051011]|uniref:hypothetical protein n=1 Tax=Sphaerisporangium sp. NPDC051011 TaxID=3155792 RepID=UPI0033CB86C1
MQRSTNACPPQLPPALGGDQLLHAPFLEQVRQHPDRTAVVAEVSASATPSCTSAPGSWPTTQPRPQASPQLDDRCGEKGIRAAGQAGHAYDLAFCDA